MLVMPLVFIIFLLTICYFLLNYICNKEFYDLAAKIEGPSAWPIIGSAHHLIGSRKYVVKKLHKFANQYKKPWKLWLGSRLVVIVTNPEDIRIVLHKALTRLDTYSFVRPVLKNGLFCSDNETWRKHRKIVAGTFNTTILNTFVDVFVQHSERLVAKLGNIPNGEIFDAFPYLAQSSLETFCEVALGQKSVESQARFLKLFVRGMELVLYRTLNYIWLSNDFIWRFTPQYKELNRISRDLDLLVKQIVSKQREEYRRTKDDLHDETPKRRAFLDHLITFCEESQNGWTDEEILAETQTLIAAGGESIGSTASFVLIMLGLYPEIQRKVVQELDDIFEGSKQRVTFEDLQNMKYLEQVIKETLRLFPVASLVGRYVTENLELKDCTIPAGSNCVLAFIHTHRNPDFYEDPSIFNPDNFSPENIAKRYPSAYLAFSDGPKNCVGSKYALMSLKTTLATLLRHFEVSSGYRNIDEIELIIQIVMKCANGYKITLSPREQ